MTSWCDKTGIDCKLEHADSRLLLDEYVADDYEMLHLRHWGTPPAAICKSKIGKNSGLPSLLRRLLLRLLPRAPRFYQLLALLYNC